MTRFNRMGQNPYTESRILPVGGLILQSEFYKSIFRSEMSQGGFIVRTLGVTFEPK